MDKFEILLKTSAVVQRIEKDGILASPPDARELMAIYEAVGILFSHYYLDSTNESDEARIGERIDEIVKLDTIIDDGYDLYADQVSLDAGRPLDFPRLLFVLLVRELPNIRLWHSHYGDEVTLVNGNEEATFAVPPIDSRIMLLLYTKQLIKDILV